MTLIFKKKQPVSSSELELSILSIGVIKGNTEKDMRVIN